MDRLLITSLIILIMISCGPSREELAREKYQLAESLFNAKQFNDAKLFIDSITDGYSDQIEYVTRAKDLLRTITIREQEENLVFLDSLLNAKKAELKPLMKNFRESNEYGHQTFLIHKRQKPENSYNRVYLRAYLNTEGDFYIASQYVGANRIYHNQIKVYNKGKEALSEVVPEDGLNNRFFEDGGNKWEVVKYRDGKDNGVIDFIASNWEQPLKVQFIGKKYYYILMEKFDKEAIRDGYEISFVLKDIARIKEERAKVKKELARLQPGK